MVASGASTHTAACPCSTRSWPAPASCSAATARTHCGRVVRPDLHHRDRRTPPLRPGPERRRLHPRRRRRHARALRGTLRDLPRHHQHRHRGRAVAHRQAAERNACAQLRRQSCRRVHHHRRRSHQPAVGRDVAGGLCGSWRRCRLTEHRRRVAGRHPRLDVSTGARLLCGCERAAARLPDVPLRPRAAADSDSRTHRRPPDLRAYEQTGAHAIASIPEFAFELSLGIYLIVKGFKSSPILDDTRYPGAAEGSVASAGAAP